jgi:hypothetical protein
VFHGTSSIFTGSIRSSGLQPEPKKKTWDSGRTRSVGGVYLTGSVQRAYLFAQEAVKRHGGTEVIVAAKVESRSAFADEDDVEKMVRWAESISGGVDVDKAFFDTLATIDGIIPHPSLRARVSELLRERSDSLDFYDRLSRTLKCIAWGTRRSESDRALRLETPIRTTRGSNRILSLVEIDSSKRLKMVFGSLPPTFFFQWRKAFGDVRFVEGI